MTEANRDAAGICTGEAMLRDLPVGAIFVVGRTPAEVLTAWGTTGSMPVNVKARGARSAFAPDTRVVVVRVIKRADVRPAGGSEA